MARFVMTEQERALVALWRAFGAYQNERFAHHKLLVDPHEADDELCWFELYADGGGDVIVDPANPNASNFKAASWLELGQAAAAIDKARVRLEHIRAEASVGRPRFGNPRKGRPQPRGGAGSPVDADGCVIRQNLVSEPRRASAKKKARSS